MDISEEKQYEELVTGEVRSQFEASSDARRALRIHRGGLEYVFHKALGHAVRQTQIPTIIIQDEGPLRGSLKHQYCDDLPIWQHGVIYHPSESWPGIQVADLVSVVISRLFRIEDKCYRGEALNLFDEACQEIAKQKVEPKLVDAWSLSDP